MLNFWWWLFANGHDPWFWRVLVSPMALGDFSIVAFFRRGAVLVLI